MMAHSKWYLDPPSPHHLKKEKNVVKVGPPLTKLSGSAHVVVSKHCNDYSVVNLTRHAYIFTPVYITGDTFVFPLKTRLFHVAGDSHKYGV